jgi:hypothetical protein
LPSNVAQKTGLNVDHAKSPFPASEMPANHVTMRQNLGGRFDVDQRRDVYPAAPGKTGGGNAAWRWLLRMAWIRICVRGNPAKNRHDNVMLYPRHKRRLPMTSVLRPKNRPSSQ